MYILTNTRYITKLCDRSTSPHWGEVFDFLIHDPREDILIIKVICNFFCMFESIDKEYEKLSFPFSFFPSQLSSGWDQPLGSLVLPLKELLSKKELLLDQWQNLDGASPESQILLRAQLKVKRTEIYRTFCILYWNRLHL